MLAVRCKRVLAARALAPWVRPIAQRMELAWICPPIETTAELVAVCALVARERLPCVMQGPARFRAPWDLPTATAIQ